MFRNFYKWNAMTAQTAKQLVSIYTEVDIYLNSWAWGHFHLITINRQKL